MSTASYQSTFSIRRLWIILAVGMVVMFSVLLLLGREIYREAPPIPEVVRAQSGETIYTREDIQHGQAVWQSIGGMQQGSIWGHGGYLAPDWSADWLHREASALLAIYNQRFRIGNSAEETDTLNRARLAREMRRNEYDAATKTITVSVARAQAIAETQQHYLDLYTGGSEEAEHLREEYAFSALAYLEPDEARALSAFYFWTAWGATTNRPDKEVTYTSNWPHEPLVDNTPTPPTLLWSLISILLLLAGIGAIVWYYAQQFDIWRQDSEPEDGYAKEDRLASVVPTASMRATAKFFWIVAALFVLQVLCGIVTAHYGVEGQGVYGLPLAEYFPYVVTRTWHTQLAVFWIATAWLACGLYVAPLLGGKEPKFQRFGVNFLFYSLLLIVVGSFFGEWAAVHRLFSSLTTSYWFGHQGYEYIDLGRFWQIYLFIGLLLWLGLVLRGLWPALTKPEVGRSLIFLVVVSSIAIGLLYGAGLFYGQHTHIALAEYWRWWVVHLWVEGIFEVFATAIISLLFVRMGLVRASVATVMVLFATIIFLFGGVLGTFHHLYFTGTPTAVLAVGATFSALEVVPLLVVGFEAWSRRKHTTGLDWEDTYYWPFMFFAAVLFWNFLGAGVFGFLINPPIALYYMQGLNTTANHGHAALFGVYGMLGLGLTLYCMRGLTDVRRWNNGLLKQAFWSFNIGLLLMTFLSLLPQGLIQTWVSIRDGYQAARSPELLHSPLIETLVWLRVPGDVIFAWGVFAFALFMWQAFRPKAEVSTAQQATESAN